MNYDSPETIIEAVREWQDVSARVATHPQPLSLMTDLRKAEDKLRALRLPPEEECACGPGDTCSCSYDCECRERDIHTFVEGEGWRNGHEEEARRD